jgi:fatty-acyl-CoA synthase
LACLRRWQAIQKVYRSELETLEDLFTSMDVTVTEDKIHGSMVAIVVKAASDISHDQIRVRVTDLLARYTLKYNLTIE